ncbi:hypothetical protein LMJF_12_0450 [Leishmania major strain Friedlin]|uniref:Uncharacterized protein n=1 Tax=Leishmania major TaxID=5664 RepID=Q4QGP7_LEIMA|nr:hypothetical protein LMJF_12_0450 [Leishmania major strain Friedlin]CAG9570452.1 hypothetical_protein_-_conserved [Leishmania major strain Friedlin]CAJ02597.1 hypothetical protein LMJF_12_0450 [Leishmania major strain Friedlin]|eukprot:XP_001681651.1 hypothetical protein LMJF_12_0450 [Leishmania major strain Friedlin]
MSSTSVASLSSQRGKATTTMNTTTTTRPTAAPAYPYDANTKGLETYLPRLQAAASRASPVAPSKARNPLPEGSAQSRYLPSSSLKALTVAGAAEPGVPAARSRNDYRTSPVRGRATLGSSQQRTNWGVETAEERDSEDDQQARSPLRTLANLPQRTQELCEDLITLDSLVEVDEAFFTAQEDMEARIMALLRSWREAAAEGDSRGGSRRPSGVYALATASTPTAAGTQLGDAVASSSSGGGGGGGGTQRVLQDFDEARDRIALLEKLHEELTEMEGQHRELQRRYVVEGSPLSALDELCARLDGEDGEMRANGDEAGYAEGSEKADWGAHRDGRSKARRRQERDVVRAGIAACRLLADRLRSRGMMIVDRLTDELLCMRSEVTRHDWTALQSSTPLTRMDRVAPLDSRNDSPVSGAPISWCTSLFPPPHLVAAVSRGGRDSARLFANSSTHYFGEAAGGAHGSDGDESDRSKATVTSTETPESFVLRVQVPVFASAAPPALATSLPAAVTTTAEGATVTAASFTSRVSGDSLHSSGSAERMRRRSSGAAQALSTAPPTTVSVIATPTRYALVQLYEYCREGLAAMLTRLCALRTRHSKEAELLQQEQSAMDVYDPAADDLADRCAALLRYVAQLDAWAGEVLQMDQVLHERVKLPLDAALQTCERVRNQLLEVLKQRLEDEEGRHNERAAAAADAEEYGGEADDRGEHHLPHERVCDDNSEELHALPGEGGEGDVNDQRRMSGSIGDYRAHRVTQPPARASCGAAPPTALPRASAAFIGMLETILQDQQTAGEALCTTATTFAGGTSGGERELDTGEHCGKDGEPSEEAPAPEQGSSAAEGHSEGTCALAGLAMAPEAEPVNTPSAAHSHRTTATVAVDKTSASAAADTQADRPSEGIDTGHVAGRRRQRDDSEDESEDTPSHSVLSQATERKHAHTSHPTSTAAPSHEITVYISSTSCSELGEELGEDVGVEPRAVETQGGVHRLAKMPGPEPDDSDGDDDVSDSDSGDDSRNSREGNLNPANQRQRYALGSSNGLGEGLRAFFSAVVRRAMSFNDSDDDADETEMAMTFQGRQQGGASQLPSHKRARRE